jgi:VWFA-related protein
VKVKGWTVAVAALAASAAAQERPVFRTGIEVIQVDVSVLDAKRRPVRGLTAGDFTIIEDGKPQRILAFNDVDIADPPPSPSPEAAWTREVAPDVRENSAPDGRLMVIVMDDGLTPADPQMMNQARAIARGIMDRMSPGDLASVVFTASNHHAQDFTDDRVRLRRAIDTFNAWSTCGGLRDPMSPHRDSPLNVLFHLTGSLAAAPQRRKMIFFIGVSVPDLRSGDKNSYIKAEMYRRARLSNITIYPIDPSGVTMEEFLTQRAMGPGCGEAPPPMMLVQHWREEIFKALDAAKENRHTLNEAAANTGGIAVLHNNDAVPALDPIFEENASYYVLGYETPKRGDQLRRIEVKVNRLDVTVRTRSFWRPPKEIRADATPRQRADFSLSGIIPTSDIPMRLTLAPFASASRAGATVAIVVGMSEAVPPSKTTGRVNLAIGAFTPQGDERATQRQEATVTLVPAPGKTADVDVLSRLDLKPGRYSVRVGAYSGLSKQGGSVYADVDVPDFKNAPLSLSGIIVASSAAPFTAPKDHLSKLFPVVPTTQRTFAPTDGALAFLRVYQAVKRTPVPAVLTASITDATGAVVARRARNIGAEEFGADHAVDHRLEIPSAALAGGEYLLTFTVVARDASARRDLRFAIR